MKKGFRFSFQNFAKVAVKRQTQKKADTFILIYGLPRAGKTTLGFDILLPYLKLKRRLYREGKSSWEMPRAWSKTFNSYFATDASDMSKKIKINPNGSFTFVDEGLDVASWHEMMKNEQKDLIELIQKTGSKGQLTILIIPNLSLMTKALMARAHYLFIIIDEPHEGGNYAYLFKNYTNPILAENFPFGLKRIIKDILKYPIIGEKSLFENYIIGRDRFVGKVKFRSIDKKLYDLYDKLVKIPSLEKDKEKRRTVPRSKFNKLTYAFDIILFNLKEIDNKPIIKIERMLRDKFGTQIISQDAIRRRVDRVVAMQIPPMLSDEDVFEEEPESESPSEDIDVDSSLESLEGDVDGIDETDEEENQIDAD
jgi:hypothetical protein